MAEMSGKDLGVELKNLLIASQDKIPAMADIYGDINGKLAGTADSQGDAFYQHEGPHGTSESRIFSAWTGLRDELQNLLGQTQTNLNDTATTLTSVVNHYANQDEAAGTELRTSVSDHNEDAYHPEDNPDGDKNLTPLPEVGEGQDPVDPPDTTDPTLPEDNY